MANTKYILEKIKLEDGFKDLLTKTNGENVAVTYNGSEMTLAQALTNIFAAVSKAQTSEDVQAAANKIKDDLIGGASGAYDTLKEIEEYIEKHGEEAAALLNSLGEKASKEEFNALKQTVEGLGAMAKKETVSEEDLAPSLKAKVNAAAEGNHSHENITALNQITTEKINEWDNKANKTEATESEAGLMSADDKKKLNTLRGVRYGDTPPDDMQAGELFVRIVNEE